MYGFKYLIRNPISSFRETTHLLKNYPPSNPYYVRFFDSHRNNYTDAKFFKIIRVSPKKINYCSPRFANKWELAGRVVGGEWDKNAIPFEEKSFYDGIDAPFHESLQLHFEDGVSWEDTPFVQQVLKRVNNGTTVWTCSNPAEVEEKCNRVDQLYERINEHGFQTHEERLQAGVNDLKPSRKTELFQWVKKHTALGKDEITVNIARDGTLLRHSGKHRLSISKILELESIPVLVLARHKEWQNIRDQINDTGRDVTSLSPKIANHPDLDDIT